MKNWIIGAIVVTVAALGSYLFFGGGEEGRKAAGLVLVIGAMRGAVALMESGRNSKF